MASGRSGLQTYDRRRARVFFLTPDTPVNNSPTAALSVGVDPLTRNSYTYVNGDPVNLSDPTGHIVCPGEPGDRIGSSCPDNPAPGASKEQKAGYEAARRKAAADWKSFVRNGGNYGRGESSQGDWYSEQRRLDAAADVAEINASRPKRGWLDRFLFGECPAGKQCVVGIMPFGPDGEGADPLAAEEPPTYEPSPKHDEIRPGVGAQPTNPEEVLASSVEVKTGQRIGYDPSTGEIVVFRETYPGENIYHGYVSDYGDLAQDQRNALYRAGLVSLSGKPMGQQP